MQQSFIRIFTGISGFICVLMGAAAAHWLADKLEAADLERIEKAATYQMYHTLALLALAVLAEVKPDIRFVTLPASLFMAGIVLFSGSLYAYSFLHWQALVYVTPFGGLCFMAGWLMFALKAK